MLSFDIFVFRIIEKICIISVLYILESLFTFVINNKSPILTARGVLNVPIAPLSLTYHQTQLERLVKTQTIRALVVFWECTHLEKIHPWV